MKFKVGDMLGYKTCLCDWEFEHVGRIHTLVPNGIPSCREPMVMLEGKAGVLLASHCTLIPKEAS